MIKLTTIQVIDKYLLERYICLTRYIHSVPDVDNKELEKFTEAVIDVKRAIGHKLYTEKDLLQYIKNTIEYQRKFHFQDNFFLYADLLEIVIKIVAEEK